MSVSHGKQAELLAIWALEKNTHCSSLVVTVTMGTVIGVSNIEDCGPVWTFHFVSMVQSLLGDHVCIYPLRIILRHVFR